MGDVGCLAVTLCYLLFRLMFLPMRKKLSDDRNPKTEPINPKILLLIPHMLSNPLMGQEGSGLAVLSRECPEKAPTFVVLHRQGPEKAPTYIVFTGKTLRRPQLIWVCTGKAPRRPRLTLIFTGKAPRRLRQAQRRPPEGPDLHWFLQGRPRSLRLGFTKVNEGGLRLN